MSYQISSSCDGCCFAVYKNTGDEKQQTACELGRIEKFKDRETKMRLKKGADGEHFVIDRFCTCYRPDEWLAVLDEKEKKNLTKVVREEICVNMGIIIFFDEHSDQEGLIRTIECFKQQTQHPRYVVVVNNRVEYNEIIHELLIKSFPNKQKTNIHLVQCLDNETADFEKVDIAFQHALNGFYYVINAGEEVQNNFIEKFDSYINDELNQVVMVKPEEKVAGLLIQASLHKLVNGSKTKMNDDESMNRENVVQRVVNMAIKNGGIDLIKDWSEIV